MGRQAKIVKPFCKNNVSDQTLSTDPRGRSSSPSPLCRVLCSPLSILAFVSVRTARLLLWLKGGAALHFHKVMGSTGSRKDKINHLIQAKQGGGGVGVVYIFRGGRNRRTCGRIRGKSGVIERRGRVFENRQGGSRVKGRRQVETQESNYLHKCLCCAL